MEYNYTKEWKQPYKVYRLGAIDLTTVLPEGLKVSTLATIVAVIILFLFLGFLSMAKGITFISELFSKGWLLIMALLVFIVWIFSSLKYDNKNVFLYFKSLFKFAKTKNDGIEHEDKVVYMREKITYFDES